jgi:hypothetical protein
MTNSYGQWTISYTDALLISVLTLVVVSLWWQMATDFCALRRMRRSDGVLSPKRLRFASVSVMLEFLMAALVSLCVFLLLKFLFT